MIREVAYDAAEPPPREACYPCCCSNALVVFEERSYLCCPHCGVTAIGGGRQSGAGFIGLDY